MNTLVLSILVAFALVCFLADTTLAGFKGYGGLGSQVQWDNGVYPAYKGYGGYGGYGYGGYGPYGGYGGYGPFRGGYGGYGFGPFYG